MAALRYHMLSLLSPLVTATAVGTNRGLLHVLWMLVSGALLLTRGAVIPGLQVSGLTEADVRRAWAALGRGKWTIAQLLARWGSLVQEAGSWQPRLHGGYGAVAADITAIFRPRLQGCPTTHYHAAAGRALPAIPVGVVARTGAIGAQRLGLPVAVVRAVPNDGRPRAHERATLHQAVLALGETDVLVVDRGFSLGMVQDLQVPRYVVRLTKSVTARRATPPTDGGRGRPPRRGALVRPLARRRRRGEGLLAATPPDVVERWWVGKTLIRADGWLELVRPDAVPSAPTFTAWVFHDPRYAEPLVVAATPALPARVVLALYLDRWPVEQLPLAAKQMIGAGRQFVHATEMCQRLPEIALLAGAILSYAAATGPLVPTGCWDRRPRRTPGRLRRALRQTPFPHDLPVPARIRRKASVTGHLRTGAARWQGRRTAPARPLPPQHRLRFGATLSAVSGK